MTVTRNTPVQPHGPKIGIVYYSFSGQSLGLVHHVAEGLRHAGCTVVVERLQPVAPLRFPLPSIPATIRLMVVTFFRKRVPIAAVPLQDIQDADLLLLAGPTWSYNPSGPVLSLLDQYGKKLFKQKTVLPLISCRGYWRLHWFGLRRLLENCGARVPNCMVFTHPSPEPWRTIGVFLKIAGRTPETSRFLGKYYPRFGHTKRQRDEAYRMGMEIGQAVSNNVPIEHLDFRTSIAMPPAFGKNVRRQRRLRWIREQKKKR